MTGVYLIHFDQPYKHAKHYIGFALDIDARLFVHSRGTGARLMQVLWEHHITWRLAKIWKNESRTFERSLKNKKHASRFCPICQAMRIGEVKP